MSIIIQRFHALTLLSALLAAAVISSCNDNPTTIGSDYLPESVEFGSYTLKPEDFQITSGIAAISNSSAQGGLGIGVGRTPDGIVAHGLIAITSESPIVSGASAKPVQSAMLRLHGLPYRHGDTSTAQIEFDIVELDQVFPPGVQWNDAIVSTIESAPVIGSYNGPYPASDSVAIEVPLNPTETGRFLQDYFRYDSSSGRREFRTLRTLALRAKEGNRFVGTFFGVQGVTDSLRPVLRVFTGTDTVNLSIGTTAWIANSPVATGPGRFLVMAGVPIRTLIKLNLDSIPVGATIHQAELKLHIDKANSRFGTFGEPNFLVGYIATDTSFIPGSYLTSELSGVLPVNRPAIDSATFSDIFRFTTLGPTVGAWLRNRRGDGTLKNQGIILAFNRIVSRPDLETVTTDRLAFFGPDAADPSVRPALTIIYSVQVDANK